MLSGLRPPALPFTSLSLSVCPHPALSSHAPFSGFSGFPGRRGGWWGRVQVCAVGGTAAPLLQTLPVHGVKPLPNHGGGTAVDSQRTRPRSVLYPVLPRPPEPEPAALKLILDSNCLC